MKKIEFVDLHAQYLSIKDDIDNAIARVISETAFIKGKYLEEFENAFAKYAQTEYCIGCANGTDSLEIALRALGVGAGDEVLVPANTWISTAEAVTTAGATVVFVDNDAATYNVIAELLEKKITKKTKAIIPVHLYGRPAEMEQIMELAKTHNLRVIEDSAQAHGAKINGKQIGTFGDTASFSFFPGKNLGAYGDAGALIMSDKEFAVQCRMIGDHGRLGKHDHGLEGRNSRLDGLQASILLAKLPYLPEWTIKRRQCAAWYHEALSDLEIPKPDRANHVEHVYHVFAVQVEQRDQVQQYLQDKGIPTGIHYPTALPFTTAYKYKQHTPEEFPVAFHQMSRKMSLPIYPELTKDQVGYIADNLKAAVKQFS